MIIKDMVNIVKLEFSDKIPSGKEIITAFNNIIRSINIKTGKEETIINAIEGLNLLFGDLTELGSTYTETFSFYGNGGNGYFYDEDDFILTLPRGYRKVNRIYIDNIEYRNVSLDVLKANTSSCYYSSFDKNIHFGVDVSGTEVNVVYERNYAEISFSDTEYTDINEFGQELLIQGALYILLSRPRYKDNNKFNVVYSQYKDLLSYFVNMSVMYAPTKAFAPKYTY